MNMNESIASSFINRRSLAISAELMRALAHPLRIKIINFIDSEGSSHVNKIYNSLKLEQSVTSQHLRILRNAGLVEASRQGKYIYYTINKAKIEGTCNIVEEFFKMQEQLEKAS